MHTGGLVRATPPVRRTVSLPPILAILLMAAGVPTARGAVDLQVESIVFTVPQPGPMANETVPVTVTVVNLGDEQAGPFDVLVWHNRATAPTDATGADASRRVAQLGPGQANGVALQFDVTYDAAGTYTLWAWADAAGAVTESDETNNQFSALVPVTENVPDLIVMSVATDVDTQVAGESFNVIVEIKNQGRVDAGTFQVGLWKDRDVAPTDASGNDAVQAVQGLSAGETLTLTFPVTYDTAGDYSLWALVDAGLQLPEVNEDNNALGGELTVEPASGGGGGGGCLQGTTRDVFPLFGAMTFVGYCGRRRLLYRQCAMRAVPPGA